MAQQKQPDDNHDEESGESLTEILTNPEITKALNTVAAAWADNIPKETSLRSKALMLNILFSALVLIVIGGMGYLNILSKDVTGSIIGSLIGYWYGRYQTGR